MVLFEIITNQPFLFQKKYAWKYDPLKKKNMSRHVSKIIFEWFALI